MTIKRVSAALWGVVLAAVVTGTAWADAVSYVQVGSIGSPGPANQMIYSSSHDKLVLRNGGSAIRVVDLSNGSTQTFLSTSLFTDMSLSPSGRYVYVADYGYEDIGYGTPLHPSHVGRLDLDTGAWQSKDAAGAVAYHVEAVDDDHFILTSFDQWITLTYNSWGSGTSITVLTPMSPYQPGYFAFLYEGDVEYDSTSGRLIHGNSGLSSQEIAALRVSGNTFVPQESSGTYGTASNYGGSSVLAVDGSAFYYGRLQVDPLDVSHNRRAFPEVIRAANGRAAFGNGAYYDAATGGLLGSLGFATTVYGPNHSGADFWTYDASSETLRHFSPSDGPLPVGPQANPDLVRTGPVASLDIDVLANDLGFANPVTVTIDTPPGGGTATVTGSPGSQSGVRIHYVPNPGFVGSDSLVYTVSDGTNSDSANVSLIVDSYQAINDSVFVGVGSYVSLYVARNDVGFTDPVTISITSPPSEGYVSVSQASGLAHDVYITYDPSYPTPTGDYTDTFSYQISDGVHSDTATVTVHAVSLMAVDDSAKTNVATPVYIDVTDNDIVEYSATVVLYETAKHGSVSQDYYGSFVYTPDPGFVGTDFFIYALDDGSHVSFGTVTVQVVHDQDGDGIEDAVDNCTLVPNPDQRDTDGDGYGNMCDADLNNDGIVNFSDLSIFRQRYATKNQDADFDGNGFVSFPDLSRLRLLFLKHPGPSGLHP